MNLENNPTLANAPKENSKINLFNEGIIIGLVTLWGYLAAYRYELGYLEYFQIPQEFIEISIPRLLNIAAIVTGFLITAFYIIHSFSVTGIFNLEELKVNPVKRKILLYVLFSLIFLLNIKIDPSNVWFYLAIVAIFVIWEVFWLFCVYNKGSFKDRILLEEKFEDPIRDKFLINKFSLKNRIIIIILLFSISSLSLFENIGKNDAKNQNEFLSLDDNQLLIIIGHYSDKLIVKPFNKESNTILNKIRIIVNDEISSNKFIISNEKLSNPIVEK